MITTEEYPIRYVAFANPGRWVRWTRDADDIGREMAVFCDTHPNPDWPGINDGVYVAITSRQMGPSSRSQPADVSGFYVAGSATRPDRSRAQSNDVRPFTTFAGAMEFAEKWLAQAYVFCGMERK